MNITHEQKSTGNLGIGNLPMKVEYVDNSNHG